MCPVGELQLLYQKHLITLGLGFQLANRTSDKHHCLTFLTLLHLVKTYCFHLAANCLIKYCIPAVIVHIIVDNERQEKRFVCFGGAIFCCRKVRKTNRAHISVSLLFPVFLISLNEYLVPGFTTTVYQTSTKITVRTSVFCSLPFNLFAIGGAAVALLDSSLDICKGFFLNIFGQRIGYLFAQSFCLILCCVIRLF